MITEYAGHTNIFVCRNLRNFIEWCILVHPLYRNASKINCPMFIHWRDIIFLRKWLHKIYHVIGSVLTDSNVSLYLVKKNCGVQVFWLKNPDCTHEGFHLDLWYTKVLIVRLLICSRFLKRKSEFSCLNMFNVAQNRFCYINNTFLSPAGAVGPGTGDIAMPPVCLSVRLSVRHV